MTARRSVGSPCEPLIPTTTNRANRPKSMTAARAPYSLSQDEHFAREGWSWRFPADAATATIVGKDCY